MLPNMAGILAPMVANRSTYPSTTADEGPSVKTPSDSHDVPLRCQLNDPRYTSRTGALCAHTRRSIFPRSSSTSARNLSAISRPSR
jgi:hypothetical protein